VQLQFAPIGRPGTAAATPRGGARGGCLGDAAPRRVLRTRSASSAPHQSSGGFTSAIFQCGRRARIVATKRPGPRQRWNRFHHFEGAPEVIALGQRRLPRSSGPAAASARAVRPGTAISRHPGSASGSQCWNAAWGGAASTGRPRRSASGAVPKHHQRGESGLVQRAPTPRETTRYAAVKFFKIHGVGNLRLVVAIHWQMS